MQDIKKLIIWQKAYAVSLAVYHASSNFPKEESYGLTSQIRRAATSIPANIAEGCGRIGNVELGRFAHIALGSSTELESHLLMARDLNMLDQDKYTELESQVSEVRKMLISFIKKIKGLITHHPELKTQNY